MSAIFKFDTSGAAVKRYELDRGNWQPEDLHRNQTISFDPITFDVVLTSTFDTFTRVETFGQTLDTTDDASLYVRKTDVFKDKNGNTLTSPGHGDSHGGSQGGFGGESDPQSQGGSSTGTFKFVIDGTSVQRFDYDDGNWHPEDLHRNQTISADPVTHDVTLTSTFATFTEVQTFSQTPDTTDDPSFYTRTSDVFTATDGTVLPANPHSGAGDEHFVGTGGKDQFAGGTGNDHINGGTGNDVLGGGEGDDDLIGGAGNDKIDGGAGLDVISGDAGNDTLSGGADDDSLSGGIGNDTLKGGVGADYLSGGDGKDSLVGDLGNDTLQGGAGDDKEGGGVGNDHFLAGVDAGNDKLDGGKGEDLVDYSGASTGMTIDFARGIAKATLGDATSGTDKLSGIEDVVGSAFDDIIFGNKESNVITGGAGADMLTGGKGGDVFVFAAVTDGQPGHADTITDFTAGDKIDLSAIDAIEGAAGSAFTLSAATPAEGSAAGVVWFDAAAHTLYASTNADAAPEIAIMLSGVNVITAADLVL